ncbi:5669bbdc-1d85-4e7c-9905-bdd2a477cb56 [Sclerotinia trifoliorum]|uniref:5669bbdc-1d85-4e7c-9905-bdd2a477cb56 n=1 Tax=Sclerotinia trifoliorum TaxID=28548 RepID=A0A8H2VQ55_9HELO|nr:5669bbdc-1d85-4e7c-9905-bdd2a477cb56 [Sclerotinia trifoliorum]
MSTNSLPNSAWAFNTMASMKKGPTVTNTTKNGVSTFAASPPLVTSSPANPPPGVAPPKRNNGFAFSMVGGCSPASQQPTPAFAPAPAPLPPHPVNPPTYLPPPYTTSSFFPSTTTAVPFPYTNNHSSSFFSFVSSAPIQASPSPSTPTSFTPPAETPARCFIFDGLNQRTTEEMDSYLNSLDEMDWDWTDDYLLDCCDVF